MHTWDLWYPEAAATGLPFARSKIDPIDRVFVHAAPPSLEVEVRTADGARIARGENLCATADTPIARLTIREGDIIREDVWPGVEDIGAIVILPGGEAGKLISWWNASDHSEWRWQVELYNQKG